MARLIFAVKVSSAFLQKQDHFLCHHKFVQYCTKQHFLVARCSDVNKDLGLKAKAKDLDPKAKTKAQGLQSQVQGQGL